ncbi:MAG: putative ATPase (AAA+ superfamily) [Candidatus Tokpelaia sp. JSC085]|nr:MAG: putative ATPase (AAA+ superfamily) [Candidatus Tokpelaia sp. JSC085]
MKKNHLLIQLDKLISILSRIAQPVPHPIEAEKADCFVWNPQTLLATPVKNVNRIDICLIVGINNIRDILIENTRRFAKNLPANNVLLWGARGMGKSSLIKAAQGFINQEQMHLKPLKLIEIHREDISTLPLLMKELKKSKYRFILFCDDLSFDYEDTSYRYLKTALDGSVEGPPENVLFYATSNRRHLMPRDMIDNERSLIHPSEAIEEKVSLSDRFGLWLGFNTCSRKDYLTMVENYARYYRLDEEPEKLHRDALAWSIARGSSSGRVAWQFIQDLAGRLGKTLI